jgi:hypothetical protein
MNFWEFLASVIGSIAWPTAIVVSVWMFREKLGELMPLLRLKYKDFEASFKLDQAEKEAATLPPAPADALPTKEEKDKFQQLAELSPQAAIVEVRRDIEETLRKFAKSHNLTSSTPNSAASLIRLLRQHDLIDHSSANVLDTLRGIGNQAAHSNSSDYSIEDALRYKELADLVLAQLRGGAVTNLTE